MIVILLALWSAFAFALYKLLVTFQEATWQSSMSIACILLCAVSMLIAATSYRKSDAAFTAGAVSAVFWVLVHPLMLQDPLPALLVAGVATGGIAGWQTEHISSWFSWSFLGRFLIAGAAAIAAGIGPLCAYAQFEDMSLEYVMAVQVAAFALLIWITLRSYKNDAFRIQQVPRPQTAGIA